MRRMKKNFAALAVVAMVAAACGGDDASDAPAEEPAAEEADAPAEEASEEPAEETGGAASEEETADALAEASEESEEEAAELPTTIEGWQELWAAERAERLHGSEHAHRRGHVRDRAHTHGGRAHARDAADNSEEQPAHKTPGGEGHWLAHELIEAEYECDDAVHEERADDKARRRHARQDAWHKWRRQEVGDRTHREVGADGDGVNAHKGSSARIEGRGCGACEIGHGRHKRTGRRHCEV